MSVSMYIGPYVVENGCTRGPKTFDNLWQSAWFKDWSVMSLPRLNAFFWVEKVDLPTDLFWPVHCEEIVLTTTRTYQPYAQVGAWLSKVFSLSQASKFRNDDLKRRTWRTNLQSDLVKRNRVFKFFHTRARTITAPACWFHQSRQH